jgi:hypothetical protein
MHKAAILTPLLTFVSLSIQTQRFTQNCTERKIFISFFFSTPVRNILLTDKYLLSYAQDARAETRVGLHGERPLSLSDFNQIWYATRRSRVVICRQTDRHGEAKRRIL